MSELDLYLLHAPVALEHTGIPPTEWTPRRPDGSARTAGVPIAATWRAMERLVDLGLCRRIGVSNFSVDELDALRDAVGPAATRPYCNQIEGHPYHQQRGVVAGCAARGVRVVAFSPLGRGGAVLRDPVLAAIATAMAARAGSVGASAPTSPPSTAPGAAVTPAQVCLRWNLQRGVAVIPHTVAPAELAQNAALLPLAGTGGSSGAATAAARGPAVAALTPAEMDAIARLDRGERGLVLEWGASSAGDLLDAAAAVGGVDVDERLRRPPPVSPGTVRLWHIPTSRSSRVLWLLRELEAAYPMSHQSGRDPATALPEVEVQLGAGALYTHRKPDWCVPDVGAARPAAPPLRRLVAPPPGRPSC